MSQPQELVPVGNGFLWLTDTELRLDELKALVGQWKEQFPGVPLIVLPRTKVKEVGREQEG